ncbi:MAG: DUF3417 domain-containing protein, partial [Acidobacteriota bacterium]
VREYTEQHYLPAATTYLARAADKGIAGVRVAEWRTALGQKWAALRLGEMKVETGGEQHLFEVQVSLDDLDPDAVRVELYADGVGDGGPVRQEMKRGQPAEGGTTGSTYRVRVPATRPATDYTVRLIPHHDGVAVPLETAHILWQR